MPRGILRSEAEEKHSEGEGNWEGGCGTNKTAGARTMPRGILRSEAEEKHSEEKGIGRADAELIKWRKKMEIITGGVTAAQGFLAACTAAGIKYQNRVDMAMVYSKAPCLSLIHNSEPTRQAELS